VLAGCGACRAQALIASASRVSFSLDIDVVLGEFACLLLPRQTAANAESC